MKRIKITVALAAIAAVMTGFAADDGVAAVRKPVRKVAARPAARPAVPSTLRKPSRKAAARPAARAATPGSVQPVNVAGGWTPCNACTGRPHLNIMPTILNVPSLIANATSGQAAEFTVAGLVTNHYKQVVATPVTAKDFYYTASSGYPPNLVSDGLEYRFVIEETVGRKKQVQDDTRLKSLLQQVTQQETESSEAYAEAAQLREAAQKQRDLASNAQAFNQQNLSTLGNRSGALAWISRGLSTYSAANTAVDADRYERDAARAETRARASAVAAVNLRREAAQAQGNIPMRNIFSVGARFNCQLRDNDRGSTVAAISGQSVIGEDGQVANAVHKIFGEMASRCKSLLNNNVTSLTPRTRVAGIGAKGITLDGGSFEDFQPGDTFTIMQRQARAVTTPTHSGPAVIATARVISVHRGYVEAEVTGRTRPIRIGDGAIWQFRTDVPGYPARGDFGAVAAINQRPLDFYGLAGRGVALARQGDMAGATGDIDAAMIQAKSAVQFNHLCYEAATSGVMLDRAAQACQSALTLMPGVAAILDSQGFVMLRSRKFDDAITYYSRALALKPGMAGALYGRAVAWWGKGDATRSDADMKAAIKIEPNIVRRFSGYGVSLAGVTN